MAAHRVANFQTLVWDLRLFVILQTFLLLLYICLKPRLFCTSHHKTTSKHPRIQKFWLYFAKAFCNPRQERGKPLHPAGSSCAWAGLWLAVTRTLSASRSFQTLFKHNVGNPGCPLYLAHFYPSSGLKLISDWEITTVSINSLPCQLQISLKACHIINLHISLLQKGSHHPG